MQTRFRLDRAMAPRVRRLLAVGGTARIVDLCSGGSGQLLLLVKDLADAGVPVRATMTDLYPNVPAFEEIGGQSGGRIGFETRSVDARNVPADLTGLRTIFNGFHHLRPADARSVLHAAAAARQPIAIFELSERTRRHALPDPARRCTSGSRRRSCARFLAPAPVDVSRAGRCVHVPVGFGCRSPLLHARRAAGAVRGSAPMR